ncbi:MAG: hypothetical protein R3E97_21180 [Candidatus Eisenbacteria bacterium]
MFHTRRFLVSSAVGAVALAMSASTGRAQIPTVDVEVGRFGLETMAIISPSLIYRPLDMNAVRPDARALGMGGAYLAMADDPLGIGWNPAAVTGPDAFTLSVDAMGMNSSSSTSGYPTSIIPPGQSELFVTSYNNSLKSSFRYGTIAFALPVWESGARRIGAGFAWRRFGQVGRPEETILTLLEDRQNAAEVSIATDQKEKGAIEAYGPTLGLRLFSGLDVGVSGNFLTGRNRVNQTLEQDTGGQGLSDLGFERFTQKYSGFAMDLGVRLSVGDRARLAMRYTPEYDLEVTGGTWQNKTVDVANFVYINQTGTLSGYDQTVPAFMSVGVALKPTSRIWLTADYTSQKLSETTLTYTGLPAFDPFGAELVAASVGSESFDVVYGGSSPAVDPALPAADLTQVSFGAEYVLFRNERSELPIRIGFRSTDLPYLKAASEDYSYRYLHEEVMDFLGISYEELLQMWDPAWNGTGNRKRPRYTTIGLRYNGAHGEQPTGTGFSLGASFRTGVVSYDLGIDWFSYTDTRFAFGTAWNAIFNPNPIEGDFISSVTIHEDDTSHEEELPAPVRHPSVLEVDRSVTTFRLSATYSFPGLF